MHKYSKWLGGIVVVSTIVFGGLYLIQTLMPLNSSGVVIVGSCLLIAGGASVMSITLVKQQQKEQRENQKNE